MDERAVKQEPVNMPAGTGADAKEWTRRIVFLTVAAAFFVVPLVCPVLRNYDPGVAVIAGVIFAVTPLCSALRSSAWDSE